jgi:hypothetical protein
MAQEYASASPKLALPEVGWVTSGLGVPPPRRRRIVAGLGLSPTVIAAGALILLRSRAFAR